MICEICRDEAFLARKAEPATPADLQTAADLLETLEHHRAGCVGMAANMIGVSRRIIAFDNEGTYLVMFNPEIVKRSGPYQAEEGCLSLSGTRPARTTAMQPEPLQRSAAHIPGRRRRSASSTSTSVSGWGMSTAGVTASRTP